MLFPSAVLGGEHQDGDARDVGLRMHRDVKDHLAVALHRRLRPPIVRIESAAGAVGLLIMQVTAERRLFA